MKALLLEYKNTQNEVKASVKYRKKITETTDRQQDIIV